MSDGYEIIDILLFAAIAGFLLLRLRSVLGRRTGNERPPARPAAPQKPLAPPSPIAAPTPFRVVKGGAAPVGAAGGVAAVRAADPSFAEDVFLRGARGAFEIVINAFAAGDTAALQPLLSKDVFDRFAVAIRARQGANEKPLAKLVSIKSADIAEALIEGTTALVTVKFVSDQTNVTIGRDGKPADGDPDHAAEHVDLWTFARPSRSRDPNWTLVATHSP